MQEKWVGISHSDQQCPFPYRFPAHDIAQVHHHVHVRGPRVKLPLPGGERGQGHYQEEGPVELVLVEEVREEGDCLDGLSQTHLIC